MPISTKLLSGLIVVMTTTSLGLIGWTSKNLYSINRELGTVKNKTDENSQDIENLEEKLYEYLYDKRHSKETKEV